MTGFDRRGVILERASKRRAAGSRFGDLGDRFAKTFAKSEPPQTVQFDPGFEQPAEDPVDDYGDSVLPRFPISRQGYDCGAVEEHLAELEDELASLEGEVEDLRAKVPPANAVSAEIERIGEQTSAILLAAHDEAQQTIRAARAQANDCISDAASYAVELTEQAKQQLAEVEAERSMILRQRDRLIEDMRTTATALASLAEQATHRISPQPPIGDQASDPAGDNDSDPSA